MKNHYSLFIFGKNHPNRVVSALELLQYSPFGTNAILNLIRFSWFLFQIILQYALKRRDSFLRRTRFYNYTCYELIAGTTHYTLPRRVVASCQSFTATAANKLLNALRPG